MDRYKYTDVKNRKYLTTKYPKIKPKIDDIIIEAKYGTRLDLLANKYYKDSSLWWIIAKANALPGDSYFVDVEQKIRIPRSYLDILKKIKEG